jgi:hypothetical protein
MPIGVPQREQLVHYAIRGALAAVDLMIWPVAAATAKPSGTTRRG